MTKQLYEEALADVKKLKEVAEDNAKKALIEAVTPRIKDLVENELMKKPEEDDLLLDDEFEGDDFSDSMSGAAVDLSGGSPDVSSAISLPDEEGKVTLDLDSLMVEPGEFSSEYVVKNESKKTLGKLVEKMNSTAIVNLESKLFQISEKVDRFSKSSELIRKMSGFKNLVSEVKSEIESLYEGISNSKLESFDKQNYKEKLENLYKNANKLVEQGNMRNRNRKMINEADITLKLTGMPDDINLDDIGVDLVTGGEEEGEEPEEEEAGEEEEGGEEEGEEPEEEEAGEEEEGGEEEDVFGGEEEEGGEEEDIFGGEEKKGGGQATQKESRMLRNPNLVVEIDENMLRREITKMKNLRESRESNDVIVEIDENMLRREIKRMRTLRESKEGMLGNDPHKWGHGPGKVSDEFEDDDLGDPFTDISLREADEPEGGPNEMYGEADEPEGGPNEMYGEAEGGPNEMYGEADEPEGGPNEMYGEADEGMSPDEGDVHPNESVDEIEEADEDDDSKNPNEMKVESLRRRIAQERRLQLEAKKKAAKAKKGQRTAQTKAQMAHNEAVKSQQKGQKGAAHKKGQEARAHSAQGKKLGEAYAYFATQFNESVIRTRRLMGMLNEATSRRGSLNGSSKRLSEGTENLQRKLAETNLFNTKLLYSNKLLQNESLTRRQKAEVIEKLDEARSDREVKLVYETMVKALEGSGRQLSEAADRRVLGSSSQATRPASTLNEGVELNRWAKLAGIK